MTVLRSGLTIGPKLGNGHFGEVFRATDPVRGDVAVKILRQTPLETLDQWQYRKTGLLKEGVRLSAAKHKNVVEVIQFLEADNDQEILLVMELCRGGSLQTHFENGPMQLSMAKNIATNIALGLQTLHLRGMLHRDIKPANLLLDENGVLKLGDFGLVTDELILGYGAQAGYTDHIAYEVWNGSGTSARSDIWAAGMTIYRLLHGANWYQRSKAPRYTIRNGKFADSLKWLPHIPQHWRRLIRKTLQDNPHSRYETATKFFNALSPLPCVQPEWKCTVEDEAISWSKQIKDRIHQVEWKKEDNDKYSWSAWSEPVLIGKRRNLGASSEPSSLNITDGQLQKFFRP